MAQTIWKYPIETTDELTLPIPATAEVLTIQIQQGQPCVWVKLDPSHVVESPRRFRIVGTGHPIENENLKYINTYQLNGGSFVFHLFEVGQ